MEKQTMQEKELLGINEIYDRIREIVGKHEGNIDLLKKNIELIDEDIEFVKKAKKEFKNPKYNNDYITRKLGEFERTKEIHLAKLKEEENYLNNANSFLKLYASQVEETKNEETGESKFQYNSDFYLPILKFASVIGFTDLYTE